jgi:hypothetical protein
MNVEVNAHALQFVTIYGLRAEKILVKFILSRTATKCCTPNLVSANENSLNYRHSYVRSSHLTLSATLNIYYWEQTGS